MALIGRSEPIRACYYAIAITVFECMTSVGKVAYNDPRPYWLSDDVQAFRCSYAYGNPSGHTMIGVGFNLLIALDLMADYEIVGVKKAVIVLIELAFGASIGYSRMFLGVHTLD